MNKIIYVLVAMLALSASAVQAQPQVVDRIIGVVNGEIITLYELNDSMKPVYEQLGDRQLTDSDRKQLEMIRRQLFEQMINDILLVQTANSHGIEVSDGDVENYIQATMEERGWSEDDYQKYVKDRGLTMSEAYERVRNDMLRHRLLSSMVYKQIVVTDKDVREYFDEHSADFDTGRMVELRLIYLDSLDEILSIRKKIVDGEMTFAEAADKFSKGPGAGQGGDLGQMAWDDLSQEWRDALEGMEVGAVSTPFKVQNGVALLTIVSEGDGTEMAFEEVKDGIFNQLMAARKEEVLREYVKSLRDKAVIEDRL